MLRTILSFVFFTCILFSSCLTVAPKVTKEEAIAAAKRLESVVESRNMEGFSSFFDKDAFCKILATKCRAVKDRKAMKGFKSGFSMMPLAKATIEFAQTGSYHFLRHYEKDGRHRVLFRIYGENGFAYQDFQLIKVNNTVKAEDMYSYSSGEDITTTVAEVMDVLLPEDFDTKDTGGRFRDTIVRIKKMKDKRDYEGIKESYERLPAEYQQIKGVLMVYIEACQNLDNSYYKAAMEKFAQLYPDAPNSYLLLLDAYILDQEYDKALVAIDKLDKFTGGDPFLNFYRGNLYKLKGEIAESKTYHEKAFAYDPGMLANMEALIMVYVEDKETDKAKKIIASYKASKSFKQKQLDYLELVYPHLFN